MSIPEFGKKINPKGDLGSIDSKSSRSSNGLNNESENASEFEVVDLAEVRKFYSDEKNDEPNKTGVILNNENKKNIITIAIIILVGTGSYGLGRLSMIESSREPIRIIKNEIREVEVSNISTDAVIESSVNKNNTASVVSGLNKIEANMLVGSKTGTKYHFPWCSGAQRIKNENKVWFGTPEEARKAGYTPAANCKGLE